MTELSDVWTIECHGNVVREVKEDIIHGWMQNYGNRVGIGYNRDRHVAISPTGTRFVQMGYILIPEKDWLERHADTD